MRKDKGEYPVFSRRIAEVLENLGFKYKRIEPNFKYPGFNVWVYTCTPQLLSAIDKINGER